MNDQEAHKPSEPASDEEETPQPAFALAVMRYEGETAEHVDVPEGAVRIGDGAFAGHREVRSVRLPSTLESIGAKAFVDCAGLERIEIPEDTHEIGPEAFRGCTALREVVLPDGLEELPRTAFAQCTSLKRVLGGASVRALGVGAFRACGALASIPAFERLESVGRNAFSGCRSLSGVKLGDACREIGDGAFANCKGLSSVVLPDGVERLGTNVFAGCDDALSLECDVRLLDRFPDAFPRAFMEARGRIRPQDKWIKKREYRDAHAERMSELREGIARAKKEAAALKARRVELKEDEARLGGVRGLTRHAELEKVREELAETTRRRKKLKRETEAAEREIDRLQNPTWDDLVSFFANGEEDAEQA